MLAAAAAIGETETVATEAALGRVLAADLISGVDVPPLDNAQMDGYAVRCTDVPSVPARLPVALRVAAGHAAGVLAPGSAARIFTGAPIPQGGDAVVMQEDARAEHGAVWLHRQPQPGQWIRRAGSDVRRGAVALPAGQALAAQHLGVAASVGAARVSVVRRPRVALLCTGDELTAPGQPLPEGGIYNSNRYMLAGLLESLGCAVRDLGVVRDSRQETLQALQEAARQSDLILSSGGVSVGEEDHVRAALQSAGELSWWSIAMRPGKPLAFGRVGTVPFIGLPGNPVSSFVGFALFVRPFLLRLLGARAAGPLAVPVQANFRFPADAERRSFLRARIGQDGGVELAASQNSAVLTSLAQADGLVDLPAGTSVEPGQIVRFLPLALLAGPP